MRFALAAALSFAALTGAASAQTYPDHSIRMIHAQPAGPTDTSARLIAADMSKRLGQTVVVEPQIGANGLIAARTVIKAKPDGYTLYYGSVIGVSSVFNTENAVAAETDLTPISNLAVTPYVLMVNGKLPIHSIADFVAYSKANPGKLNYASTAGGSAMLLSELVKSRFGIDAVFVPYPGTSLVMNAMLAGDVAWTVGAPGGWTPHYRDGAVVPLFVTSAKRMPYMPNVPTSIEVGQNLTAGSSFGLWGPKGLSRDIVMKLNEAGIAAINNPEIAEKLRSETIGIEPIGSTPEEQIQNYRAEFKLLSEGAKLVSSKK